MFPVRLGLRDQNPCQDAEGHPVVLMVTVDRGSQCQWQVAIQKALRCRDSLRASKIDNVEVLVAACGATAQASMAGEWLAQDIDWNLDGPNAHTIQGAMMPLLPLTGCTIVQERAGSAAASGALGPVLSLGPGSSTKDKMEATDRLYGLTSRHVAVGDRLPRQQAYNFDTAAQGTHLNATVLTGTTASAYTVVPNLDRILATIEATATMSRRKLAVDPANEDAADKLTRMEQCKRYVQLLVEKVGSLDGQQPEFRRLGKVVYTPCFQVKAREGGGNLQDWALIGLAATKKVHNNVYLDSTSIGAVSYWVSQKRRSGSMIRGLETPFELNTNGLLRLHGRGMPDEPLFFTDSPSCLVGKRGPKTGLTFGHVNEIEAVTRQPHADGPDVISLQMLILPTDDYGAFSARGDSGSAIFDCNGCVVGMIDAGTRINHVHRHPRPASTPAVTPPVTAKDAQRKKENVVPPRALPSRNRSDSEEGDGGGPSQAPAPALIAPAPTHQDPVPSTSLVERQFTGLSISEAATKSVPPMDMTFATPIQWLLADIKEFTGRNVQIA